MARKGEKMSEEIKRKIAEANRGRKWSEESKAKRRGFGNPMFGKIGELNPFFGKKHKPLTILKLRLIGRSRTGENAGNWQGGITKNEYGDPKQRSISKNKRNLIINRLKRIKLSHSVNEWELLKKRHRNSCVNCKKSEPVIKLERDHIIPLSRGGTDLIINIQPLCSICNHKKHTKIVNYTLTH
jgi:5-methylcytosine-specific restriction protein A